MFTDCIFNDVEVTLSAKWTDADVLVTCRNCFR